MTRASAWRRWRQHVATAKYLPYKFANAVAKYGEYCFELNVLEVCETYEEVVAKEISCIAEFEPEYNLTKGGDGLRGCKRSEEFKRKISERMRGEKHPMYGKKHTPETVALLKQNSAMLGRKLSEQEVEQRRLRALSNGFNKVNLGRKFTEEHKNKIRAAALGRKLSEETKAKIQATRRSRCVS